MEKKKLLVFKILMTLLFAIIIFGAYFYVIFGQINEPLKDSYFKYGCVCACFLFSLLFLRKNIKQFWVTLALAIAVVADYFLILFPSEQNQFIGVCVFCAMQLVLVLYTLSLSKSIGAKVVNLAFRVALCLVAYFVLPLYFELGLLEMISVLYIINFFFTIVCLLFHIKTEAVMLIGALLFFACDIFVGLTSGAADILGIAGSAFMEFLSNYDMIFYCYIPGLFLIALSSVWRKGKKNENI